jgi:uncharacterized protein (UPF0371 family)
MQHRLVSDTDVPEAVNTWARDLFVKLNRLAAGQVMNQSTVGAVQRLLDSAIEEAQSRGLDVPQLVIMPLVKQNAIEVFRRDLDTDGIQRVMLRLVAKYPSITETEIVWAVRSTWPEYGRQLT